MNISSALNIAQHPYRKLGDLTISHSCPWCGSVAWSGRQHMQCLNRHCPTYVASAEDIILHACGGNVDAATAAVEKALHTNIKADLEARKLSRLVIDFWVKACVTDRTTEEQMMLEKLMRSGLDVAGCRHTIVPLGRGRMQELMRVAIETDADMNEGWTDATPPQSTLVYCIQTVPHTIDRLVLHYPQYESHITWSDRRAGICGLIGLTPGAKQAMVTDRMRALAAQASMANNGEIREVVSIHTFSKAKVIERCDWAQDSPMLVAVPSSVDDVIMIQQALHAYTPTMLDEMLGASVIDPTYTRGGPDGRKLSIAWTAARRGWLAHLALKSPETRMSPDVTRLFEMTGSLRDDATWVCRVLESAGRAEAAADMLRLARTRKIPTDGRVEIFEGPTEYQHTTPAGPALVASFAMEMLGGVVFPDRNGELCHRVLVRAATSMQEITVSNGGLANAKKLEEEVQTQFVVGDLATAPSVIDFPLMNRWVLRDLRETAARLPCSHGQSHLGWSDDRKTYTMPGLTLRKGEKVENSCIFHPSARNLRIFKKLTQWVSVVPAVPPAYCADLVAGIVAQVVRAYRHCTALPLLVAQDSVSVEATAHLLQYTGQTSIHQMNQNNRDNHPTDGLRGYPFLVSGGGPGATYTTGLIVLAPSGFRVVEVWTPAQVDAAGQYLQAVLQRVVTWCLDYGAPGFVEVKSMANNAALIAEGQWIIKQVCDIDTEVTTRSSTPALEWLFSQIPLESTSERLTLRDDMVLETNVEGVDFDAASIAEELKAMDAASEVAESIIRCKAPVMLPALTRFYGSRPETRTVAVVDV